MNKSLYRRDEKRSLEVNHPLTCGKLNFYNTKVDPYTWGNPFAGGRTTYGPGLPYDCTGVVILCIGAIMYMMRRRYGCR